MLAKLKLFGGAKGKGDENAAAQPPMVPSGVAGGTPFVGANGPGPQVGGGGPGNPGMAGGGGHGAAPGMAPGFAGVKSHTPSGLPLGFNPTPQGGQPNMPNQIWMGGGRAPPLLGGEGQHQHVQQGQHQHVQQGWGAQQNAQRAQMGAGQMPHDGHGQVAPHGMGFPAGMGAGGLLQQDYSSGAHQMGAQQMGPGGAVIPSQAIKQQQQQQQQQQQNDFSAAMQRAMVPGNHAQPHIAGHGMHGAFALGPAGQQYAPGQMHEGGEAGFPNFPQHAPQSVGPQGGGFQGGGSAHHQHQADYGVSPVNAISPQKAGPQAQGGGANSPPNGLSGMTGIPGGKPHGQAGFPPGQIPVAVPHSFIPHAQGGPAPSPPGAGAAGGVPGIGQPGQGQLATEGMSKGICTVCHLEVLATHARHKTSDGRYAHLQCAEFEAQQKQLYGVLPGGGGGRAGGGGSEEGQHVAAVMPGHAVPHNMHVPQYTPPVHLHGSGGGLHNTGGSAGGMYGSGGGVHAGSGGGGLYGSKDGVPGGGIYGSAGRSSPKSPPSGGKHLHVSLDEAPLARTSKGGCAVCNVEIWSDQERVRQEDGRYIHLACHDASNLLLSPGRQAPKNKQTSPPMNNTTPPKNTPLHNAPPIPPRTPPDAALPLKAPPPLLPVRSPPKHVGPGAEPELGLCIICGLTVAASQPHKRAKNGTHMHLACLDDDSPSAGTATVMAAEASEESWGAAHGALPPFKPSAPSTMAGLLARSASAAPAPGINGALPIYVEQDLEEECSLLGDDKNSPTSASTSFGPASPSHQAAAAVSAVASAAAAATAAAAGGAVLVGGGDAFVLSGATIVPHANAARMSYGGIQNPMALTFVPGASNYGLSDQAKEMTLSNEVLAGGGEDATKAATSGAGGTGDSPETVEATKSTYSSGVTKTSSSASSSGPTASRVREEAL